MGDGLFVHALHSLAVISIGCSIIVPFQGGKKRKKLQSVSAQHSDASSAGRKFKAGKGSCFDLPCRLFGTNLDTSNCKANFCYLKPTFVALLSVHLCIC